MGRRARNPRRASHDLCRLLARGNHIVMSSPAVVDIHNPAWWRREDDIFDAQLDAYDGVPMTEEVRATLLMMAWAEIAQLRLVQKVMALEGSEPPKQRGRPPKVREPASQHRRYESARGISVSANQARAGLR